MDIKITDITYHRNGSSGRGFYSIRFAFVEPGSPFKPNMLAIVPSTEDLTRDALKHVESGLTECYVVDLNAPTQNWRGDNFVDDMLKALRAREAEEERVLKERVKAARKRGKT